jgi:glyoxylase-like metal-dependent hydrolase (beta-lactamase superfamily II)/rhodanese-related sulfurtransferase
MILRQFILDDLASAAYLVGDQATGVAALVDPHLEVEEYLRAADFFGVKIEHVLETHSHADRVSGHGRLGELGATIHIHRDAQVSYPHEPFDDGWTLRMGDVEIRAMHTPGHRPEHTAFVLTDHARGPEAWAVLTGDSLFVSDIARPDLAVEAESGARALHESLHQGLLRLPPETEVWPGHIGGSLCGGPGMDLKTSTTVGYEVAHNPLLAISDVDQFVELTTTDLPPQPANFTRIVDINSGDFVDFPTSFPSLPVADFASRRAEGAMVVDCRPSAEFDERHIPGAISIPSMGGGFANRLAWLARPGEPILIVGRSEQDALEACRLAGSVGIDSVVGCLAGGYEAWPAAGEPGEATPRLPASKLAERLNADPDVVALDVRERAEWSAGVLDGTRTIPYHELRDADLSGLGSATVAVVCASGQRAGIAASVLRSRGIDNVIHVTDGGVTDVVAARTAAG